MAKKRKLKQVSRNIFIYLVMAVIVLSIVGFSVFRIVDLKLEERQLLAQQEALIQEKEKLKEQLENVNNPEFIEQEARKQLKLIMPGETLYILKDEADETDETNETDEN
jgi:cell division protein DivIC